MVSKFRLSLLALAMFVGASKASAQSAKADSVLRAAATALNKALSGSAVASKQTCVYAVSAFYANERTTGSPGSIDTVLFVPPKGALRDSLIKADSLLNGAILPDVADSVVARPIFICVGSTTALRAALVL